MPDSIAGHHSLLYLLCYSHISRSKLIYITADFSLPRYGRAPSPDRRAIELCWPCFDGHLLASISLFAVPCICLNGSIPVYIHNLRPSFHNGRPWLHGRVVSRRMERNALLANETSMSRRDIYDFSWSLFILCTHAPRTIVLLLTALFCHLQAP